MITVYSDDDWRGFCRALGNPPWSQEERFSDALSRWKNQDELDKLIEEWTLRHDHVAVMHLLQKEGVACGPVEDQRDAYNDTQLKDRGFFEQLTHVDCGTHLYPGMLYKLSKTPLSIRLPPCRLGEHNEYVYKKVIGVSDQEYAALEKAGHIGMDFDPSIP
jgi:crotonobetainyl-CoA:carnitine CoA-transferase CaiB-like acyl-CoA transferase